MPSDSSVKSDEKSSDEENLWRSVKSVGRKTIICEKKKLSGEKIKKRTSFRDLHASFIYYKRNYFLYQMNARLKKQLHFWSLLTEAAFFSFRILAYRRSILSVGSDAPEGKPLSARATTTFTQSLAIHFHGVHVVLKESLDSLLDVFENCFHTCYPLNS